MMFLRKRLQCLRPSSHYYSTTAPVFDRREERRRVHRERRERRIAARETKHDNDDNAAAVEDPLPSEPLPSEPPGIEEAAARGGVNSDVYKTSKSDDEEAAEAKRFWMTTRKLFRNVCITGAIFCVTCDATDLFDCKQVLRPLLGL